MVTMVTMGGDLQPGCLADWLLTGLGQPQINKAAAGDDDTVVDGTTPLPYELINAALCTHTLPYALINAALCTHKRCLMHSNAALCTHKRCLMHS